jgi:hypothetical protein
MKRISHYSFAALLAAAVLHFTAPSGAAQDFVIGNWQDNDGDGWTDNSDVSITNAANMPAKYEFLTGAVAGYPQSLSLHENGFGNARLKINLTTLGGALEAFTNNTKMRFTFSCPPDTGAAAGYMQLVQFQYNSPGSGFQQISSDWTNSFSAAGDTANNSASGQPIFYFYASSPARSQVVTWDYSSVKSNIMSAGIDYLQLTFVFQTGGGAPTNVLMNNVVIVDDTAPAPLNLFTVNTFASTDEVLDTANSGANAWGNWFGTAYYQAIWNASDASNNPASGSLRVEAFYPDAGNGGCCGPQFLAQNGQNGINPPIAGNGNAGNVPVATNISFDIRFDPMTDVNGSADWPTIEVGTRGVDFGQYIFGTVTLPATQTNWVRVNIPIAANGSWTNIPQVFFKHYSGSRSNWVVLYIDNIQFARSEVQIPPPQMTIQKATPSLRLYSGPNQYNRTQIGTVDSNQSWVGGSYPVSYSFTIADYDKTTPLDEFHLFLLPLSSINGGTVDQYSDYSTASNSVRIQIVGLANNPSQVAYQLAWKTNLINSNPNQVLFTQTNTTAVGTWTLAFISATAGTLTAPGSSPVPFTIPADAAATFANPLVMLLGTQSNPTTAIGQYVDLTAAQTVGVAAPGVPVSSTFTSGAPVNTNIWLTSSVSQSAANLIPVGPAQPWWLNWTFPDTGFGLATKADLGNLAVPFKSPEYFTGYDTNTPILKLTLGTRVSALIPQAGLPTLNGLSNGVPAGTAFFRLQKPGPAE